MEAHSVARSEPTGRAHSRASLAVVTLVPLGLWAPQTILGRAVWMTLGRRDGNND